MSLIYAAGAGVVTFYVLKWLILPGFALLIAGVLTCYGYFRAYRSSEHRLMQDVQRRLQREGFCTNVKTRYSYGYNRIEVSLVLPVSFGKNIPIARVNHDGERLMMLDYPKLFSTRLQKAELPMINVNQREQCVQAILTAWKPRLEQLQNGEVWEHHVQPA